MSPIAAMESSLLTGAQAYSRTAVGGHPFEAASLNENTVNWLLNLWESAVKGFLPGLPSEQ